MSDLANWKLRGPVQTLTAESASWDLTGEDWESPHSSNVVHFRRDAKINNVEFRNANGYILHTNYSYDDFGRLIQKFYLTENGVQQGSETFSYDAAGRKTSLQEIPSSAGITQAFFSIDGAEQLYSAADAVSMTTIYNERDEPVEALLHDTNRRLLRRVIFTRDRAGKLEKEEMQLGDDETPFPELEKTFENAPAEEREQVAAMFAQLFGPGRIMCITKHAYDEKGRRVERLMQMSGISEQRSTYRFDEHDNPIEETHVHTQREINSDEAGNPLPANEFSTHKQVRNTYKYDNRGNWTELQVSVRLEQNLEFQPMNIERRQINYYDA